VTQKVFTNLMEDAKSSCLGFFPTILFVVLCLCVVCLFLFRLESSFINFLVFYLFLIL